MANKNSAVVVGRKPTTNYSLAVIYQAGQGSERVTLVARGRLISKACDASQQALRLLPGARLGKISLRTENHENTRVSVIEIPVLIDGKEGK